MDFSKVNTAIQSILDNDPAIRAILGSRKVVRDEYINNKPDRTPWVGVYKGEVISSPRTLGHNNWEEFPSVRIVAQTTNSRSGQECGDALEALILAIKDAMRNDLTLNNTVDMINGDKVEYGFITTDQESLHFQSAIITFDLEAKK